MIIDMQLQQGPVRVAAKDLDDLLFYFIHENLYTKHVASNPSMNGLEKLQLCSNWYCEAIAFAARLWSGDLAAAAEARMVKDISALCSMLQQWDGLSAAYYLLTRAGSLTLRSQATS